MKIKGGYAPYFLQTNTSIAGTHKLVLKKFMSIQNNIQIILTQRLKICDLKLLLCVYHIGDFYSMLKTRSTIFTILVFICGYFQTSHEESCGCGVTSRQTCPNNIRDVFLQGNSNREGSFIQRVFELNPMIYIPGGAFVMGTNTPVFVADQEGPAKNKSIKSFYLDTQEVSNEEFEIFVNTTGYITEVLYLIVKYTPN